MTRRNAPLALRRPSPTVSACHQLPTDLTHHAFFSHLYTLFSFASHVLPYRTLGPSSRELPLPHIEAESCVGLKRGVLNEQFLHVAVICLHRRAVPVCKADAPNTAPHK
jgi:hypothetical protein